MDQVHLYRQLDPGQQAHAPPLAKGAERLGEDLTGFREFLGKLGFRVRGFDLHMAGNGLDHLPMHTDGACAHSRMVHACKLMDVWCVRVQ
jgi:hypothetical protein